MNHIRTRARFAGSRLLICVFALLCCHDDVSVFAADVIDAAAAVRVIHSSGSLKFTLDERTSVENAIKGEPIQGRLIYRPQFRLDPRFRWLACVPGISNPTGAAVYCSYHVSLFDRDGAFIGGCSQSSKVSPGAVGFQLGSVVVKGPPAALAEANRYQITVYESTGPLGEIALADADAEANFRIVFQDARWKHAVNGSLSLASEFATEEASEPDKAMTEIKTDKHHYRCRIWVSAFEKARPAQQRRLVLDHEIAGKFGSRPYQFHGTLLDGEGNVIASCGSKWDSDLSLPLKYLRQGKKLLLRIYPDE